ncbi:lipoyl(octanoyl) transferase LipB [Betaproteobacteria bacterium PRO7]|nr:lipoyl(octanoyl) transferase LipB [Betaproteobacteria bacterium PRO7]
MSAVLAPPLVVRALGRVDYVPTWHAMREFTARRDADTPDELWIVEHPPVFTLGQAGRREHLLGPTDIPVVATDRGGQITYHGPGQVVIYTLIDLRRLGIFVKELVYRIEQSVIQTLDAYGVEGRRVKGAPGIYVPVNESTSPQPSLRARGEGKKRVSDPDFSGVAKIAALGIKVTNGRSYHGVAFNVAMDLSPFALIDPCGYPSLATVDLATLRVQTTWHEAAERLAARLADHLSP